jgi:hypothetical protein
VGFCDWANDHFDFGKDWAPISALLTGDVFEEDRWPAAGAVWGGEPLCGGVVSDQLGLTVLWLTAAEVRETSEYLATYPLERLIAEFDDSGVEELRMSLNLPDDRDPLTEVDRLRDTYTALVEFYARAAASRMAMIKMGG